VVLPGCFHDGSNVGPLRRLRYLMFFVADVL
jgi:hypothetical protein